MAGSHRGSNLPILATFGFPDFGGLIPVGVRMACLSRVWNSQFVYVLKYRLWYTYVIRYCFWLVCSRTIFGLVGDRFFSIRRSESRRGTGLVRGRWRHFNAHFSYSSHVY